MNTNLQGNIGEAKALQYFIKEGYEVYLPFGTASKCDMVVIKDNKIYRVSVKTCSFRKKNRYRIKIRQGKLNEEKPFDKNGSEILFVYIIPIDKIFVFDSKDIQQKYELYINVG